MAATNERGDTPSTTIDCYSGTRSRVLCRSVCRHAMADTPSATTGVLSRDSLQGVVQIGDQEFALPRTGDSHSRTVSIDIPAGLLKRGDNDIWFVFKDNVDGTTSGYYASAICVAAP